eukprot:m.408066 g.408066  ORF g.408066 m.408066 type:complete len:289 (-) comp20142_c1_seq3:242-1108(-)
MALGEYWQAVQVVQPIAAMTEAASPLAFPRAELAAICGQLSQVLLASGDVDRSSVLLQVALRLSKELGDTAGQSRTCGLLASLHVACNNLPAAISSARESVALAQSAGDTASEARSRLLLGNALVGMGVEQASNQQAAGSDRVFSTQAEATRQPTAAAAMTTTTGKATARPTSVGAKTTTEPTSVGVDYVVAEPVAITEGQRDGLLVPATAGPVAEACWQLRYAIVLCNEVGDTVGEARAYAKLARAMKEHGEGQPVRFACDAGTDDVRMLHAKALGWPTRGRPAWVR